MLIKLQKKQLNCLKHVKKKFSSILFIINIFFFIKFNNFFFLNIFLKKKIYIFYKKIIYYNQ
jgi:hypothetical protein